MSISQNFPSTRPSLNLNFARSQKLDPRITFTRSSSATYTGGDGLIKTAATDTPRFDFNATTGECLGLLIEESRTNLLLQSTTPDNLVSPWGKGINTTRVGVTTAPDGTNTAVYYSGDGSSAIEYVNQGVGLSSNTTYTVSVWAKLISGSVPTSGNIITAAYNNGTGEARSNVSFNGNLTTEWKRFSTTYTNINATTASQYFTADQNNTAQIAIWGAQVEAGAFPTSYIPTVASTVTRSTDNASITGTNFSSFYNPSEGTLFASIRNQTVRSSISYDRFIALCGSDVNLDEIAIYTQTASGGGAQNKFLFSITAGGTNTADFNVGGPDNVGKTILAYKTNDAAGTVSGITPATDTSVTLPTCVSLQICSAVRYQQKPTATIQQIIYYPVRLSNSQLQSLTK